MGWADIGYPHVRLKTSRYPNVRDVDCHEDEHTTQAHDNRGYYGVTWLAVQSHDVMWSHGVNNVNERSGVFNLNRPDAVSNETTSRDVKGAR